METNPPVHEPVYLIEVEKIAVNPFQPRKVFNDEELRELANSIREFGLLQPIVVTKIIEEAESGTSVRYELIAGERRLRASKLLGLERIPAIVKNVQLDRERLEMAIVENVQRANLNPVEAAKAYNRLQDEFKLTQREIAVRIGKSREAIANTMRLLNLPTVMQDALSRGQLSESQARLLLSVEDMAQQQMFFEDILKNSLSVRELRMRIEGFKGAKKKSMDTIAPAMPDPEADLIQKELEEALGTSVKLEKTGRIGKITIEFFSPEELHAILDKIATSSSQQPAAPVSTGESVVPSPEQNQTPPPAPLSAADSFHL